MNVSEYTLVATHWQACEAQARAIRRHVFILEQNVPEKDEWDNMDEHADHFLIHPKGSPSAVAYGRLLKRSPSMATGSSVKITRMAVLPPYRGQGLGTALLQAMLDKAREYRCGSAVLDAQMHAQAFYTKEGFGVHGEPFMDAGIEHIKMIKHLSIAMNSEPDNPVVPLAHPSEIAPVMTQFAKEGVRSVDIFSHCLSPAIYDDPDLVTAISAIARRSRQSLVRILVRDPAPLHGCDRPLVNLIQRLPSRTQLRAYTEGAKDPFLGFFCVDKKHLVYFTNEPQWQGFARANARAESTHALNEFEHLWLYGSFEDPNLRVLTL